MPFLKRLRDGVSGDFFPLLRLKHPRGAEKIRSASSTADGSHHETSRRLTLYHRVHRWDPNLDDEYLEEVADAAKAHEGSPRNKRMVQRVLENSPYPEVCGSLAGCTMEQWVAK